MLTMWKNSAQLGFQYHVMRGQLIGKVTLGRKSVNATDHATLSKAHLTVLQQSAFVAPYMEEHMQIVRSMYPFKSETWITKHHNDTFATWLQKEVMANNQIHDDTLA